MLYDYLFSVIFNNLAKLVTPDHQILNLLKQPRRWLSRFWGIEQYLYM